MSLHYLGKMNPQNWVFSVMLFTKNDIVVACYIFDIHQPVLIFLTVTIAMAFALS